MEDLIGKKLILLYETDSYDNAIITIGMVGQIGIVTGYFESSGDILLVSFPDISILKRIFSPNKPQGNPEAAWYNEEIVYSTTENNPNEPIYYNNPDLKIEIGTKVKLTEEFMTLRSLSVDSKIIYIFGKNPEAIYEISRTDGIEVQLKEFKDISQNWFHKDHLIPQAIVKPVEKIKEIKKIDFLIDKEYLPKTFKEKILYTILYEPWNLPILKNSENRKYYDKIVNSILPYKIGVENECLGNLGIAINKSDEEINKMLWSIDFNCDANIGTNRICEHRLCFNGNKQVYSLYKFCNLLTEYCTIASNGGLHYHFDFPELRNCTTQKAEWIRKIVLNYLDEMNSICKYTGHFNQKDVNIDSKCKWVGLRTEFGTIEIRIGSPKFDYSEIINEIIKLSKVITKIRKELKLEKYLSSTK